MKIGPGDIKVLVACEESQTVCKAFRALGFEAYSCDIIDPSGGHPEWHIKGDALKLINGFVFFNTMDGTIHFVAEWDLIIAHPPCTYLSNVGSSWLFSEGGAKIDRKRYDLGVEARKFFLRFYNAPCRHVAVENPVPMKIFELPPYSQIIEPYYFGDKATKKTCLWLRDFPELRETNNVGRPETRYCKNPKRKGRTVSWHESISGKDRQKIRSKTFHGIAEAMAEQWGEYILNTY